MPEQKLIGELLRESQYWRLQAQKLRKERDELLEIARSIVEFQGHITTHMRRRIEAAIANYEV